MRLLGGAMLLAWLSAGPLPTARAQTTAALTLLHTFTGGNDGADPEAPLVQGSDGNFYGTASSGGAYNDGEVFQITPTGVLTTLHSFNFDDGQYPQGALVQGSDGSFYGTTISAGFNLTGTVFRITSTGAFTTLYNLSGDGSDGSSANALVQGSDGSFYGTCFYGGNNSDSGTVFRITSAGTFTVLYRFSGSDGKYPAALVQGSDGNFYGTTNGGPLNFGTVFRITPTGALTTLYSFSGSDGAEPRTALIRGSDGNFYGTCFSGGPSYDGNFYSGYGTVFQITSAGALTTLHNFADNGSDGGNPSAALVQGSDGNFYGTTYGGGLYGGSTAFRITASGAFTNLASFTVYDGSEVEAALFQGSDGSFYGTAYVGGSDEYGTVFKLSVSGSGPVVPTFFDGEVTLGGGVYYLAFPDGTPFGYYSFLSDPAYIFHFDLGFEYVFDAKDGNSGVYFYDFASGHFFYTSPVFPFPYLYDFTLDTVLYYFPDTTNPGHYTTNPRYFINLATGAIFSM